MSKKPKVTPLKGRIDIYDIFKKLQHAVESEDESFYGLLHDETTFHQEDSYSCLNNDFDIGEVKVSYFEPNSSLIFDCKEGMLMLELCADEKTGNDYIYYREPNAKHGVGKGTLVAQLSCNGTVLEKMPEICNTDINVFDNTAKASGFDAILDELQEFRMKHVPKTVPVEYEQETGIYIDAKPLGLETFQKVLDVSNFCRVLTDEERKIAYRDDAVGEEFRRKNDPFYKEKENQPFIIDDDEIQPFIEDEKDEDNECRVTYRDDGGIEIEF
jgi:hypothetical protein